RRCLPHTFFLLFKSRSRQGGRSSCSCRHTSHARSWRGHSSRRPRARRRQRGRRPRGAARGAGGRVWRAMPRSAAARRRRGPPRPPAASARPATATRSPCPGRRCIGMGTATGRCSATPTARTRGPASGTSPAPATSPSWTPPSPPRVCRKLNKAWTVVRAPMVVMLLGWLWPRVRQQRPPSCNLYRWPWHGNLHGRGKERRTSSP
uniref:Uncharacterized protein n=2 Tax=Aegilops tauschii subsp. strangulata TaxID=200361 RepID=A0A453PI70_AEGTS